MQMRLDGSLLRPRTAKESRHCQKHNEPDNLPQAACEKAHHRRKGNERENEREHGYTEPKQR
jgi:hypothetical protein